MSRVDILIPHYNDSAGFARTLRSIDEQAWDGSFRIVVADDGSRAEELSALRSLLDGSAHEALVLTNGENRGRPYTRNVLLDSMDSELVAWLDAGDTWYPEKTARQVAALEDAARNGQAGNVWATCSYDWLQEDLPPRLMHQDGGEDLVRALLDGKNVRAYLWTILAPRQAMAAIGYFDESLPRLQDLDFFIRFGLKRGRLVQPADRAPLCAYYKQHEGRNHREITACVDHLKQKYCYIFARYGQVFTGHCDYRALKNAARFAKANGDVEAMRRYRKEARKLKRRLKLDV